MRKKRKGRVPRRTVVKVEAWGLANTTKHHRPVVEFRLSSREGDGPLHSYKVRVDLHRLAKLGLLAEGNKTELARRGPLAIRVSARAGYLW